MNKIQRLLLALVCAGAPMHTAQASYSSNYGYRHSSSSQDDYSLPLLGGLTLVGSAWWYYTWRNDEYKAGKAAIRQSEDTRTKAHNNKITIPARTICATDVTVPAVPASTAASAPDASHAYPDVHEAALEGQPHEAAASSSSYSNALLWEQRQNALEEYYGPLASDATTRGQIDAAHTHLASNARDLTTCANVLKNKRNYWNTSWWLPFKSARWTTLNAQAIQEETDARTQATQLTAVRQRLQWHTPLIQLAIQLARHEPVITPAYQAADANTTAYKIKGSSDWRYLTSVRYLEDARKDLKTGVDAVMAEKRIPSTNLQQARLYKTHQLMDNAEQATTRITASPAYEQELDKKREQDNKDREFAHRAYIEQQKAEAARIKAEADRQRALAEQQKAEAMKQEAEQKKRANTADIHGKDYVRNTETYGDFLGPIITAIDRSSQSSSSSSK